jgi:hypothetical protein
MLIDGFCRAWSIVRSVPVHTPVTLGAICTTPSCTVGCANRLKFLLQKSALFLM